MKRKFLKPMAFSLAALLSTAVNASVADKTVNKSSSATNEYSKIAENDFVLKKSEAFQDMHAWHNSHYSHYSHSSHSSHSSHQSHYSSRW